MGQHARNVACMTVSNQRNICSALLAANLWHTRQKPAHYRSVVAMVFSTSVKLRLDALLADRKFVAHMAKAGTLPQRRAMVSSRSVKLRLDALLANRGRRHELSSRDDVREVSERGHPNMHGSTRSTGTAGHTGSG